MKIAVFCGSNTGNNPQFVHATRALGEYLASNGIDVVYGGGKVGLMGADGRRLCRPAWRSGHA